MRKLLLATSALLSASIAIAGAANAATLTPNAPVPAPGTYAVSLGGYMEWAVYTGSSNYKTEQYGVGSKPNNYTTGIRSRLAPSFAATLANGLVYGATFEMRNQSAVNNSIGNAAVYIDRENMYLGSTKFGTVTLGGAVQPSEALAVGQASCYVATCGWDGNYNGFFTGASNLTNLNDFLIDTNDGANKIAYTSPSFSGFEFGVSFEPNDNAKYFIDNGAERIASFNGNTYKAQDGKLGSGSRRNTFDANVQYKGTFGSLGFGANIGGSESLGVTTDTSLARQNKKYEMYTAGLEVTAAGFTVGGNLVGGNIGGGLSTIAAGAKGALSIDVGASYAFGPFGVGAAYYGYSSGEYKGQGQTLADGTVGNPGQLNGSGVVVGGTYTLAPGATVYLEGLWGRQKVNGFDLGAAANGTTVNPANFGRATNASGVGLGTIFKW